MSKETYVQGTDTRSVCMYVAFIQTWTKVSLDNCHLDNRLLGQMSFEQKVYLEKSLVGQMSHWTIVSLDNSLPWTKVPLGG